MDHYEFYPLLGSEMQVEFLQLFGGAGLKGKWRLQVSQVGPECRVLSTLSCNGFSNQYQSPSQLSDAIMDSISVRSLTTFGFSEIIALMGGICHYCEQRNMTALPVTDLTTQQYLTLKMSGIMSVGWSTRTVFLPAWKYRSKTRP